MNVWIPNRRVKDDEALAQVLRKRTLSRLVKTFLAYLGSDNKLLGWFW